MVKENRFIFAPKNRTNKENKDEISNSTHAKTCHHNGTIPFVQRKVGSIRQKQPLYNNKPVNKKEMKEKNQNGQNRKQNECAILCAKNEENYLQEKMAIANELSALVTKNKHDIKRLEELKEEAKQRLNIN